MLVQGANTISLDKEFHTSLAKPLFLIFTESLSSDEIPLGWKLGNISPIYKMGSWSMAGNNSPLTEKSASA